MSLAKLFSTSGGLLAKSRRIEISVASCSPLSPMRWELVSFSPFR